jgi:xanthine dehydrogenase accessory factor
VDRAILEALNAERRARRAAIVLTTFDGGATRLVRAVDAFHDDPLAAEIAARFRSGKSGVVEDTMIAVYLPPPRLIITGAVHIAQSLAPMARLAGFDVFIVDPRSAFAAPERFPDAAVHADWPDAVLPEIGLDAHTGVAALSHDPKIDDPALLMALDAGCFYVGALGSRKSHARRLERLAAAGGSGLGRIHGPIGLDIGSVSPGEIAVSIVAEAVQSLRRGDG